MFQLYKITINFDTVFIRMDLLFLYNWMENLSQIASVYSIKILNSFQSKQSKEIYHISLTTNLQVNNKMMLPNSQQPQICYPMMFSLIPTYVCQPQFSIINMTGYPIVPFQGCYAQPNQLSPKQNIYQSEIKYEDLINPVLNAHEPIKQESSFKEQQLTTSESQVNGPTSRIGAKTVATESHQSSNLEKNTDSVEVESSIFDQDNSSEENKRRKGKGYIWSKLETEQLEKYFIKYKGKWSSIIKHLEGRNISQCSQKYRKIMKEKVNLLKYKKYSRKKKKWTQEEDQIVLDGVEQYGKDWMKIAEKLQGRNCKQIRERFVNKLDPNLCVTPWSEEEDMKLYQLYKQHGNKWTLFSKELGNRSENQVKNRFYYNIQKRFTGKQHYYLDLQQKKAK